MAKLNEDVKVVMLKGEKGEKGEAGTGIPSGGKTGQAIIKASDNDYDYKWGSLVVDDVANATNDGNGNNIANTYATKTELNTAKTDASNTYLTKTDAGNIYVPRIDDCTNIAKLNEEKPYMKLATLTIDHAWENSPIAIEVVGRGHYISTIQILFSSINTTDPTLQSFVTDSYDGFYLYKSATSTWDLYYKEATDWGGVGIKSIFNGSTLQNSGVHINVNITHVDFIPSDAIQAVNYIFDKIYPVGAIYMTVDSAQPSILFGGTWERIKDRFLFGAGGKYGVGATGGEAEHKLTLQEMPSHRHFMILAGNGDGYLGLMPGDASYNANESTTEEGGDLPHNNMPPFLAVHIWKRIA